MVNLEVFNSNFGEWRNQRAAGERKGAYVLLPQDLTLLKVDDYEDFLVMDVINQIDYLFNGQKVHIRAAKWRAVAYLTSILWVTTNITGPGVD